jgi:hypothetical protein
MPHLYEEVTHAEDCPIHAGDSGSCTCIVSRVKRMEQDFKEVCDDRDKLRRHLYKQGEVMKQYVKGVA